jgi:putative sigma-54 modulation protein
VAEATVFTKGPTLRAREASPDMKASIDQLVDKLERQVKRYRERRTVEPRRHTEHNGVEPRGPDQRGIEERAAEQRGDSG